MYVNLSMIDFLHTNHVFVGKHIQYIIFP